MSTNIFDASINIEPITNFTINNRYPVNPYTSWLLENQPIMLQPRLLFIPVIVKKKISSLFFLALTIFDKDKEKLYDNYADDAKFIIPTNIYHFRNNYWNCPVCGKLCDLCVICCIA